MKSILLSSFLLCTVFLFSCKKSETSVASKLTGKWKLIQVYDGYVMGGSFIWKDVPPGSNNTIEFFSSGKFNEIMSPTISCYGTYQTTAENEIELHSSCYLSPYTKEISQLSFRYLILTANVIEGKISFKYVRN